MYSLVKDLPNVVQCQLDNFGYRKNDIEIIVQDKISPGSASGDGLRAFFAMLNLETKDVKSIVGSWGGANMFNPKNAVDNCDQSFPLIEGVVAIKGHSGGKTVMASLYVSNANVVKTLPAADITPRQRWILYTMITLTSAGRKDEYSRVDNPPSKEEFAALSELGFVKINKAGAVSITTNGKNACNRVGLRSVPYCD